MMGNKKRDRKQYFKEYYQRRREQGLCRNCNNCLAKGSKTFCEQCLSNNNMKYRHKRKTSEATVKFYSIKSRSKRCSIPFNIGKEEFVAWYDSQVKICHYCGVSENLLKAIGRKKSILTVDRKNNHCGYELSNMCLACFRCNNMKSDFFTEEEWMDIAKRYISPRLNEYHHGHERETKSYIPA